MNDTNLHSGMRAKTIKSFLRKKVDAWIESIKDKTLQDTVSQNVIVTGGCIASMLLGEKVSDIDIYLRDFHTTEQVARYYVGQFKTKAVKGIKQPLTVDTTNGRVRIVVKSSGIMSEEGTEKPYDYFEGRPDNEAGEYVHDIFQEPGQIEDTYEEIQKKAQETTEQDKSRQYRPVFLSSNAITLSDRIQIVIRFYGEPDEIHKNYDFVHCTNYWTSWDSKLVLRPEALEALLARELKYTGSKYPICSLIRLRKFIQRGWKVNAGQILKLAMQVSKLDLTDIKVLEEQLTGVDTAYFVQLLDRLKETDPERVDAAYLVEIIDRIF